VFVGLIGFIGNIIGLLVFIKDKNKFTFHFLMLALAVYDSLYIICAVTLFSVPHIFPNVSSSYQYKVIVTWFLPFAHVALTGSIYLTLSITLERYTTVCHPFFKYQYKWTAKYYLAPIMMFTLLYNIPKFFELKVGILDEEYERYNSTLFQNVWKSVYNKTLQRIDIEQIILHVSPTSGDLEITPTVLRVHPLYVKIYLTYFNIFVHGILPMIVLLILNVQIFMSIKKVGRHQGPTFPSEEREIRFTKVSLLIVGVFALCHSIRWIPNIWEMRQAGTDKDMILWPEWVHKVSQFSHLMTVLSSSVNFYIYLAKHWKHRVNHQTSLVLRGIESDISIATRSTTIRANSFLLHDVTEDTML